MPKYPPRTYPLQEAQALTAEFKAHVVEAERRGVDIETHLDELFRYKEVLAEYAEDSGEAAAEERAAWEYLRVYRGEADGDVYIETISRLFLSTPRGFTPLDAAAAAPVRSTIERVQLRM
jgi:hypothetical protein